jgi:hypothetical protein
MLVQIKLLSWCVLAVPLAVDVDISVDVFHLPSSNIH